MNGLEELFAQHPPPWTFSDNRAGQEGMLNVYDANGQIVACTGDMEDCTAGDIALAHAIAAVPEQYGLLEAAEKYIIGAHARELWDMHPSYDREKAHKAATENPPPIAVQIRAALDKAGVKEEKAR